MQKTTFYAMLAFGFVPQDLYSVEGLSKIDNEFLKFLETLNASLFNRLKKAREGEETNNSELIMELSWYLEDFLAVLFNVQNELANKADTLNELAVIYKVKRLFVQRQAARESLEEFDLESCSSQLTAYGFDLRDELSFARFVNSAMIEQNNERLALAKKYAAWALKTVEGQEKHGEGVLFKLPKKLEVGNLLAGKTIHDEGVVKSVHLRERNGFSLTDNDKSPLKALDHANYCIHCHHQGKDSCSKGLKEKDGSYKVNELNIKLPGCPLEEKISEMNELKTQGSVIGALAVVTIDNPLCAGTGHRICNDCMKSCIYQKQEPVNIPLVETSALEDVLNLPYGFEIYSLLTRWNPLKFDDYLPKTKRPHKILIVGLGPAGYTLSHYLLNEGFDVVAIDGLKIEPLPPHLCGIDQDGKRHEFKLVKDLKAEVYEDLNTRKAYGFGGVAEYGITVRWDKNYLTVLRLLLERRSNFRMYGGIRFGSNISYVDAANLGFDHIALCMGAGRPNLVEVKNGLVKGVRTASDFLMTLQLAGAARQETIANLEIQLPLCVIGGGLTAIDAATESLAYYPVMVEKILSTFEGIIDKDEYLNALGAAQREVFQTYLSHAKALRERPLEKLRLLKEWGGVKVLYRKSLKDSPAYRLNHEEIEKALEEGIEFVENIIPIEFETDLNRDLKGVKHAQGSIACKTLLIAAGTQPNTVLATEDALHFKRNGKYFQSVDEVGAVVANEIISKPKQARVIMDRGVDGPSISYFGDLHPSFAGNVVKAMASAKQGYKEVVNLLANQFCEADEKRGFFNKLDQLLIARVHEVIRLTPNIVEVKVLAPLAARNFKPGQFYRLQNFECNANRSAGKVYAMEGLALTGASVDYEQGILSTIVLEMGGSSDFCKYLKPNEAVVLMGPTGEPTEIPCNEKVILVGGGLGNAVLFSIGKAMRERGCQVLYFAGYKKAIDRYKIDEIEAAADQVVWACDEQELSKNRSDDHSYKGNIIQAMHAYASGAIANRSISFEEVDRVLVIGSDKMMAAVAYARHNSLKQYFNKAHIAIGSINSPMQCMMKEICGQCIARHLDPQTGVESYVYSCSNQDQLLDCVDFNHLDSRLRQNEITESLFKHYLKTTSG